MTLILCDDQTRRLVNEIIRDRRHNVFLDFYYRYDFHQCLESYSRVVLIKNNTPKDPND